ncbi:DddA-like double-stranded DNA deaminase toxin [Saccharothrix xinjiangensis]|uniref:DddA-like double-stranded DNA deaminase toxin n=1 Tax=Saccharothrix xinjiangensis TaxID=204798 RepID=A0ABV9YDW3_9PSEU
MGEVGVALRAIARKIGESRQALRRAVEAAEQARTCWAAACAGTTRTDPEAGATQARFEKVATAVTGPDGLLRALDAAATTLHALLVALGVDSPGAPGSGTHAAGPVTPPDADTGLAPQDMERRVEALRRELPPPVRPGSGQKTHGRLMVGDGPAEAVVSGDDADTRAVHDALLDRGYPLPGPPVVATHVEMKVAARMRRDGITDAVVVVNHSPCRLMWGCENLLGVVLPEGSRLTVYGTDGYQRIFTGGKRPPWQR